MVSRVPQHSVLLLTSLRVACQALQPETSKAGSRTRAASSALIYCCFGVVIETEQHSRALPLQRCCSSAFGRGHSKIFLWCVFVFAFCCLFVLFWQTAILFSYLYPFFQMMIVFENSLYLLIGVCINSVCSTYVSVVGYEDHIKR